MFDSTGITEIASQTRKVSGKTNTKFKFDETVRIPVASRDTAGYKFTIEKTSESKF